jgi:hypothetical protein
MSIEVYQISGLRPRFTGSLANVNDFIYTHPSNINSVPGSASPVAEPTITDVLPSAFLTPEAFLANPHFSLYCFDQARHHVIFVALPPHLDLTQVPFAHQAQYERALYIVSVPCAIFERLAITLPPVPKPIFLYMSARSGSTLLSHAFNASGVVTSLSEPDVITQFVHLREAAARARPEPAHQEPALQALADGAMRFLFRPQSSQIGGVPRATQAVKLRSEGVRVMDLLQNTFPQAKNVFLYRDALGWVNSFHRIFTKLDLAAPLTVDAWQTMYEGFLQADLAHLRGYLPPGCTHLSLAQQLLLWWITTMEWYQAQWQRGTPVLAVRYADLNQERALTLDAIFAHCGLPADAVEPALAAFANDSQAGTAVARTVANKGSDLTLDDRAIAEIITILQRHPFLRHPNVWLPGTLDLALYRNMQQELRTADTRQTIPQV